MLHKTFINAPLKLNRKLTKHGNHPLMLLLVLNFLYLIWTTTFRIDSHLYKFLARDVIYTSRAYDASVRLSVTVVHWRIIANLGLKFWS